MDVRPTTTMTWFMIVVGFTVMLMLGRDPQASCWRCDDASLCVVDQHSA